MNGLIDEDTQPFAPVDAEGTILDEETEGDRLGSIEKRLDVIEARQIAMQAQLTRIEQYLQSFNKMIEQLAQHPLAGKLIARG